MPYMERRAYATCRKAWPETKPVCTSETVEFADYIQSIGDSKLVASMMVGDLQRVIEYPKRGFAIPQQVPKNILTAYQRLLDDGYTEYVLAH